MNFIKFIAFLLHTASTLFRPTEDPRCAADRYGSSKYGLYYSNHHLVQMYNNAFNFNFTKQTPHKRN